MASDQRRDMLVQTALWYYEDGLDQNDIAKRLKKSRSMVSRMLTEAREAGIIEVRVNVPVRRDSLLERLLTDETHLREVWVLADSERYTAEMRRRLVGRLAASALQRRVRDGIRLGLAWSRTLHDVISEFPSQVVLDAEVIQLSGSVALGDPAFDGPELVRGLAMKTSAAFRYLVAPLIVASSELRASLVAERSIAETLDRARGVDVALIGIGSLRSEDSTLRTSGLLDPETCDRLLSSPMVGDIVGRQFGRDGVELEDPFNDRVVGVSLRDLHAISTVIAVAHGVDKADAIAGALAGGWCDVLVTDSATAGALARRLEKGHAS